MRSRRGHTWMFGRGQDVTSLERMSVGQSPFQPERI